MRRGSMLAGLRPRDDESETEIEDDLDEAERGETEEPAPKASRATPEETREADLRASAAITTGSAPGVRAVEALRDRLRGQLAAVEVTLAALRGES